MPLPKIYNTDRERKDARNARLRARRRACKSRGRHESMVNAYGAAVAHEFGTKTQCYVCKFEREDHYTDIHHLIEQDKGGTNEFRNIIPICYYCHKDVHNVARGYKYLKEKWGFNIKKELQERGL